jgi:hypothetical protein
VKDLPNVVAAETAEAKSAKPAVPPASQRESIRPRHQRLE